MTYKNRPQTRFLPLYGQYSKKLIRFPDAIVRIIEMNAVEWAIVNWMMDEEGLSLESDILPAVLDCASECDPPEAWISYNFKGLIDKYLHVRVEERGPQIIEYIVRRFGSKE